MQFFKANKLLQYFYYTIKCCFSKNDKRCDRLIAFIDHFSKNKYDVVFIIRIHTDVMCYLINFFDFSETHSRSTKNPQKMISGKKIFSCLLSPKNIFKNLYSRWQKWSAFRQWIQCQWRTKSAFKFDCHFIN